MLSRLPCSRITLAFPVAPAAPVAMGGRDIVLATLAGCRALRFEHTGAYEALDETYRGIDAWLRLRGDRWTIPDTGKVGS